MKKLLFSILVMLLLAGCGAKADDPTPLPAPEPGSSTVEGSALTDPSLVRWVGRTLYSETEGHVETSFAASGFTVRFTGTRLTVTYRAERAGSEQHRPWFVVCIDGEPASQAEGFCLTETEQTVQAAAGLPEGEHTITILKRGESENGATAVVRIETDGVLLPPKQEDRPRFQILGASGITGHGALGRPGEEWTTENSSAFAGFGWLAAEHFGAECQFVSASGMGLCWGYRGVATLAVAYEAAGLRAVYDETGATVSVEPSGTWDHARWEPDVVIVNIGGNDWNSRISQKSAGSPQRLEAEESFRAAVTSLLERIHRLHPKALVVWTCNSAASGNGALAAQAIGELSFRDQVLVVPIDNTKDGADNHAGLATQQRNATAVITAIEDSGALEAE